MKRYTALLVLTVSAVMVSQARGQWQVWTTTETSRVLRDAAAQRERQVKLAAARNEWESFQILMRSNEPLGRVNIEAGDLHGPEQYVLRATDARRFRQHQFELKYATHRNDRFQAGWYPDALIPFSHPLTREALGPARLRAVPFDLPAGQTHGFWLDVYVPPDARAGQYYGSYRVTAEGQEAVEVPIQLTVWDFSLPRVSTLQTALGSPAQRMRGFYRERAAQGKEQEPSDWTAIEAQCAELLSRHRINATPPLGSLAPVAQADGTYAIADEQIRALREFVDRYHVNALQVPRPTSVVSDPEQQRDKLHAWLKAWDAAADQLDRPHVLFYTYLRDEPNDADAYRFVQQWGRAVRDANSVVKVLVVEQTWTQNQQWGDLYGAVDIWCPLFSLFDPESAARRQALGETIWTYTALCQREPTPWWHIDYPLLNYRVPAWIAWRYRIRGLLYWGGMSYWRAVEDPWSQADTYRGRGVYQQGKRGTVFNGEGTLVYPGRAVGYEGIAPSLRLKALRDAIEDYEYLAILQRAGREKEAQRLVMPLAGSWFEWEENPTAYQAARAALAQMIVAAGAP